jgi:hypothetical protein
MRWTRPVRLTVVSALIAWAPLAGTAVAERPSATGWSIQQSPNPEGATGSFLNAVSCADDGTCAAVGLYGVQSTNLTLAEHWDGSAWSVESTPNPKGATFSDLSGVSCPAPTMCLAVGFSILAGGSKVRPLAELRSGSSTWRLKQPPKPFVAVWAILNTVSCVSPTDCTAVGGFIKGSGEGQEQPLAEHWDGTSWSIEKVPNPHTENGSSLSAVSCPAASACEAAGSYTDFDSLQAVMAFGWNGSKWTRQAESDPGGGESSDQLSLSCTDASHCTAAGYWDDDQGVVRALIERWDGAEWTMQAAADPEQSQFDELEGVSCSAPTACTSVGYWSPSANGTPDHPMAERWNGTDWRLQSTPEPPGTTSASLYGVDCSAPGACVAVGGAQIDGVVVTLIEVRSH